MTEAWACGCCILLSCGEEEDGLAARRASRGGEVGRGGRGCRQKSYLLLTVAPIGIVPLLEALTEQPLASSRGNTTYGS
jgi:hypothetical protein